MSLTNNEIDQLVLKFSNETKALKEELFRICWFMRGSVSISEVYMTDTIERDIIRKIIDGNIEIAKTTNLPFF